MVWQSSDCGGIPAWNACLDYDLDDIALTVYPTLLLFAGVAMLIGLGAFQRLAATAERATGEHDDHDDKPPGREGKSKKSG